MKWTRDLNGNVTTPLPGVANELGYKVAPDGTWVHFKLGSWQLLRQEVDDLEEAALEHALDQINLAAVNIVRVLVERDTASREAG